MYVCVSLTLYPSFAYVNSYYYVITAYMSYIGLYILTYTNYHILLYYILLHCIYNRPTPRIDDIEAAVHAFCQLHWSDVENNMYNIHTYTKNQQLPNRCLEGLYIVTLLEHGYGLEGRHQNITLALDVSISLHIYRIYVYYIA